jgi:O-antigen/teichoic acid export membrane protein
MEVDELKRRTASSVFWSLARVGWSNVASFAIFTCLTRLLEPRTFGVYALAALLVEITRIIANAGLSDAIIREPVVDEDLASTAFWANIGAGVLVAVGVVALAGPYGAMMHEPKIVPVLYALAVLIPLSSAGGIHTARKLRDFGHKSIAARTAAASTLGGILAVGAAGLGGGVWSLVVQAAVVDIVGVAFAWQSYPWRPKFVFRWDRLRELLAFSAGMMGTQLLWLLLARVPDLFIGRVWGAAAVGVYRVAYRMIDFVAQAVLAPIGAVALVTLARLQEDPERFNKAYTRMVGLVGLATLPAIAGLGAVSGDAIHLLFGGKWDAGAPVSAVLSLIALPLTLNYFAAPALAAKGRSRVVLEIAAVQLATTALFVWLATPHGLVAVGAAYVARMYLTMPYAQWALHRHIGVPIGSAFRALGAPLVLSAVMAAAVIEARLSLWPGVSAPATRLLCATALGAGVYVAGMAVFGRRLLLSYAGALLPIARGLMPRPAFMGRSDAR